MANKKKPAKAPSAPPAPLSNNQIKRLQSRVTKLEAAQAELCSVLANLPPMPGDLNARLAACAMRARQ